MVYISVLLQYYLSQISPTSTSKLELDGITIGSSGKSNCHHVAKLNDSSYLDTDEHDIFVHVDNPEKHVTAMETFITFRVITKVSCLCVCDGNESLLIVLLSHLSTLWHFTFFVV